MILDSTHPGTGTNTDTLLVQARNILVFSSCFPSKIQPIHGVFVKERIKFISEIPGYNMYVIAPVPFFPPLRWFKRWYPFSQMPGEAVIDGLKVKSPRYFLIPEIGALVHPLLMYLGVRKTVTRLRQDFDFDAIDAHFVYPDGAAALMLAQRFRKPLVVTCRGEDILRFPELPIIGNQIRRTLEGATELIAVSEEIAAAMEAQGANPRKITVIPNGVDTQKYQQLPLLESRRRLGLPENRRIVLSVGYRLERKGFHLLVDAIPQILPKIPDLLVIIVGGQARWGEDYTAVIEERIRANNVENHVLLAGPRPPEELTAWYSAADLFVLLTSREGSPNVLMEALACGVPAVATPIGGIPQVLEDPIRGILLPERASRAAAAAISDALSKAWDRDAIRHSMEKNAWTTTATKVASVFDRALSD